jgi:hypothetical protein
MHQLEGLLKALYQYFCNSPKMHLEFTKLVNIMEIKWLKLLRNVLKWWICMFSWTKRVITKYKTFFVKMAKTWPQNFKSQLILTSWIILTFYYCYHISYVCWKQYIVFKKNCKLKRSLIVISLMQSKFSNIVIYLVLILPQNLVYMFHEYWHSSLDCAHENINMWIELLESFVE